MSNQKIKILQVLPALNSGGVEGVVSDIAKGLSHSDKFESFIVSNGGQMVYRLKEHGSTHIELPVHSKNPLKMKSNIKKLVDVIRQYNIDLIHAHSRAPAWVAQKASEITGVPFITSFHGVHGLSGPFKKKYNSIMVQGTPIIAVSGFIKDHILNNYVVRDDNIIVVNCGVDLEIFNKSAVGSARIVNLTQKWNLPMDKKIIMLPGRLTELKGHKVLIEALSKIDNDDYFCIFVGSDKGKEKYAEEIKNLIIKKNLMGKVALVGDCNDMPAAFYLSNIVVNATSTRPEAFGLTIVEAQAMGKPTIATAHGAPLETVAPDSGWLVTPNDADALAIALHEALNLTDKEYETRANKAVEWVNPKYSKTRMTDTILDIYETVFEVNYKS